MATQQHWDRLDRLDPTRQAESVQEFALALRRQIVGQEEAVRALVEFFQVFKAGLSAPGRPIANFLFLGPTGCGKTRIVEAAAEILFGTSSAIVKIDCAEFQHGHEIAKLIGSPPGYLGHRETHPLITQEALDVSHAGGLKLSFLLFDEIEKASDVLWQLLLGILDKATLTLGDNRRVDLSNTVVVMTSNLGGRDITERITGGYGFLRGRNDETVKIDREIEDTALGAARRQFSPEFMNRIDRVVTFRPLDADELEKVLSIELKLLQQRLNRSAKGGCSFQTTALAREFLLREGTDRRYGARHLKRSVERHLVTPLASLISTGQIERTETVSIGWDGSSSHLDFYKQPRSLTFEGVVTKPAASRAGLAVRPLVRAA
jgi:ATP-dependent Clp protease ATP-binding subunit ClpB